MSLVGTRPPTVDEWDKYELHHRARLATKPGLTGMWQVSGRSNITDFDELGFPELKGIFTKRNNYRKTYEKNIYTTKIFEELKKNGWIYDYYEKDEDSEEYIVAKNETGMKRKC